MTTATAAPPTPGGAPAAPPPAPPSGRAKKEKSVIARLRESDAVSLTATSAPAPGEGKHTRWSILWIIPVVLLAIIGYLIWGPLSEFGGKIVTSTRHAIEQSSVTQKTGRRTGQIAVTTLPEAPYRPPHGRQETFVNFTANDVGKYFAVRVPREQTICLAARMDGWPTWRLLGPGNGIVFSDKSGRALSAPPVFLEPAYPFTLLLVQSAPIALGYSLVDAGRSCTFD